MKALALLYHDVVDGGDWDASGFPDPVSATYKFDRHDFERHLEAASAVAARRGLGPDRPTLLSRASGGCRGRIGRGRLIGPRCRLSFLDFLRYVPAQPCH